MAIVLAEGIQIVFIVLDLVLLIVQDAKVMVCCVVLIVKTATLNVQTAMGKVKQQKRVLDAMEQARKIMYDYKMEDR